MARFAFTAAAALALIGLSMGPVGAMAAPTKDTRPAVRSKPAPAPPEIPAEASPEWARTLRASNCDLAALADVIEIVRTSDPTVSRLQLEAVRLANGRCPRFVVAVAFPHEIQRFCAAPESLTAVQTARELRRRIAMLKDDEVLHAAAAGRACRAAYEYELKNTRVVLRPGR